MAKVFELKDSINTFFEEANKEEPDNEILKICIESAPKENINKKRIVGLENFMTMLKYCITTARYDLVDILLEKDNIDPNKDNILIDSIKDENYDLTSKLLEHPDININTYDKKWYGPIHYAITQNNEGLFDILFENPELDSNSEDYIEPLLNIAITSQNMHIINRLLNDPDTNVNLQNRSNGNTALHKAIKLGKTYLVELLFTRPDIDPNISNKKGYTPLHIATMFYSYDILRLLLDREDIYINLEDQAHHTPIIHAIRRKDMKAIKMLVDAYIQKGLELTIEDLAQIFRLGASIMSDSTKKFRDIMLCIEGINKKNKDFSKLTEEELFDRFSKQVPDYKI